MKRIKREQQDPLLYDLFQAYYGARRNKRNTINALAFEKHLERGLFGLYEEMRSGAYRIGPSICFVNTGAVKREIFAADFRDRIVHHLIFNYINPLFDRKFIHDSYSCREGKGTGYGIERMQKFMRSCSHNFSRSCYILKLDIEGYFMNLNKHILFRRIQKELAREKEYLNELLKTHQGYGSIGPGRLLELIGQVIFHDSTRNCRIKGRNKDWDGLPASKSLFYGPEECGLPIGNLTSQLFGNVYLDPLDQFIKRELKIRYYGRYVDDFVLMHRDKQRLLEALPRIKKFLREELGLGLHPRKIYLQSYEKGLDFLGALIKPYRTYTRSRTKAAFYRTIQHWNEKMHLRRCHKLNEEELEKFLSSMNSYLGLLKKFNTYKLRKRMIWRLAPWFFNQVYVSGGYGKLEPKVKRAKRTF